MDPRLMPIVEGNGSRNGGGADVGAEKFGDRQKEKRRHWREHCALAPQRAGSARVKRNAAQAWCPPPERRGAGGGTEHNALPERDA